MYKFVDTHNLCNASDVLVDMAAVASVVSDLFPFEKQPELSIPSSRGIAIILGSISDTLEALSEVVEENDRQMRGRIAELEHVLIEEGTPRNHPVLQAEIKPSSATASRAASVNTHPLKAKAS